MSFGKMNCFIDLISTEPVKDSEGFVTPGNTVVAHVRAYFEQRNSTEKWTNMTQGSEVNALFRLRVVPGLKLNSRHLIVCEGKRYNIYSVENVKGRGMYLEVLAVSADG
ncbi:head-tail adaptor protein [Acetanaerobacterium elongatum]|uniref:Phage head-tail joining protein n=1 Tax=Acetanaerobacterium elongatum TaxID=258515 RepID=A0A1H0E8T8_9FIRM|nr:head-tail adaptor protein [Acetanaerobacterium elongatum]SDN78706.1 Phage head-tail joining protein [Acetanaerobacterium elongatum]